MDKKSKSSKKESKERAPSTTIDSPRPMDRFNKAKSTVFNKHGKAVGNLVGKLSQKKVVGPVITQISRKVVGASLHAVKVEVNDYCNQQCRTCYMPDMHQNMSMEIIESIANDIRGTNINFEIIGGEPLLRNDLEQIVRLAKFRGQAPKVSVYTNGTLVSQERAETLKDAGLDVAIVSLHSHIPEIHDSIANTEGSFHQAVSGIEALKQSGVKVYVATVVQQENVEQIKDTCEFVESKLQVSPIFTKYIPDGPDSPFALSIKQWREVRRWMIYEQKTDHMKEVENFFSLTGSCPSGNYILAVKADGTVQPCPFATGFTLGKMPESPLWDIYNNRFSVEKFQVLKKIPNVCEDCVLKHLCGGGCRSASYGVYDGLCGKDPGCGGPFKEWPKDERPMDVLPIHY